MMATKANYLASLPDYQVYIITAEQNNQPACYWLDERIIFIDLGVKYNRIKSYFSYENIRKGILHFIRQQKLFRQLNPDIIISPNFNFDFYWLPFICRNAKKIKEIHSSRFDWKPTLVNRINTLFEKKYDSIVTLNNDEASYFSTENVAVIPNPIERTKHKANLDNKQVIAAGRISPVKAFDQLITAWKEVYALFPDWQLHIYGQDYQNTSEQLQKQINLLGLQEVVLFKGSVDNMTEKMTEYSIYAMSSVTECFPMVLLEALSVGLPVVSYDCPNGPRNIITSNMDGLIVENQNPEALAQGLIQLIGNEDRRKEMGDHAKRNSVRFETESVMKKWITLFTI